MAKQYQVGRKRVPVRGGGFADVFRVSIVEFSCLGERHFDLAGYPYDSEEDAFASDWERLAHDAGTASEKLRNDITNQGGKSGVQGNSVNAGSTTSSPNRPRRK